MHKLLVAIILFGINGLYGTLHGEDTIGIFDASKVSLITLENGREDSGKRYAQKVKMEDVSDEVFAVEGAPTPEPDELVQLEVAVEPQVVEQDSMNLELDSMKIIEVSPNSTPVETEENSSEKQMENEIDKKILETELLEEELTYDQLTQRDGGESDPEPVPPEVSDSWYVEKTAAQGLQLILEIYAIPEFTFMIDTCPSNYVYQYEFYVDSPEKDHVNLVGVFQYDATGNQTFQLNPISGLWE